CPPDRSWPGASARHRLPYEKTPARSVAPPAAPLVTLFSAGPFAYSLSITNKAGNPSVKGAGEITCSPSLVFSSKCQLNRGSNLLWLRRTQHSSIDDLA